MSEAPERVWIQTDHIPDHVALDNWTTKPDPDEPTEFTEYVRSDRIEALEAENKLLQDAVYIGDLTVAMLAKDRSKVIAGIGRALDAINAGMPDEALASLRATLAQIKGGE